MAVYFYIWISENNEYLNDVEVEQKHKRQTVSLGCRDVLFCNVQKSSNLS